MGPSVEERPTGAVPGELLSNAFTAIFVTLLSLDGVIVSDICQGKPFSEDVFSSPGHASQKVS